MTPEEKAAVQQSQRYNKWLAAKIYLSIGQKYKKSWTVKRGEVYFVNLGQNIGSEENKIRPVVVIQANAYNFKSPVFTCAIISSSSMTIRDIQVPINNTYAYTDSDGKAQQLAGTVDLGQIKTIAKERIVSSKICTLTTEMNEIDEKLLNIFGLSTLLYKKDNVIASLQGKIDYLKNQIK